MCHVETDHTLGLGSILHDCFLPWRVQSNLAVWLPFAGRCYRSVVKDWGTACNLLDTIRCKCRLINIETLWITRKKDKNVLMLRMVIVMSGLVDQLSCHPPTVNFCKTSNNSIYLDAMAILGKVWRTSLFNTTTCNPTWPKITSNLAPIKAGLIPFIWSEESFSSRLKRVYCISGKTVFSADLTGCNYLCHQVSKMGLTTCTFSHFERLLTWTLSFCRNTRWPAIFPSVLDNLHPIDAWTMWWRQSELPMYDEQ